MTTAALDHPPHLVVEEPTIVEHGGRPCLRVPLGATGKVLVQAYGDVKAQGYAIPRKPGSRDFFFYRDAPDCAYIGLEKVVA